MINNKLKTLSLTLALLISCGAAMADDGGDDSVGFHGYLRDGAGITSGAVSKSGPQSCFSLGGNSQKFRLGNECDAYFEGGETWDFNKATAENGVVFTGTLWANEWSGNSTFGANGGLGIAKAYVEAKNIPFLNGGVAWVGERYYYRPDIHMLDLQFINMNGNGGGVNNIKAGPGTFSYAFFKDNDNPSVYNPSTGNYAATIAAVRQNFIYRGLPVNPGGKLDLSASVITGEGVTSKNGYQITILHNQDMFGGGNTVGFQYGVGPGAATGAGAPCCGRIGPAGTTAADSGVKVSRLFDHLWIQPTKEFSAEFIVLSQRNTTDGSDGAAANMIGTSTWNSFGVRPHYAFSENVSLQGQIGYNSVSSATGGPTENLTVFTIAPTLSLGSGYWSRPELRLFLTHASWNQAAAAAVNANSNNTPSAGNNPFGATTSGTTFGVQLEAWW